MERSASGTACISSGYGTWLNDLQNKNTEEQAVPEIARIVYFSYFQLDTHTDRQTLSLFYFHVASVNSLKRCMIILILSYPRLKSTACFLVHIRCIQNLAIRLPRRRQPLARHLSPPSKFSLVNGTYPLYMYPSSISSSSTSRFFLSLPALAAARFLASARSLWYSYTNIRSLRKRRRRWRVGLDLVLEVALSWQIMTGVVF